MHCVNTTYIYCMDVKEVERLIKISRERPLMPETYIPWQLEPEPGDIFLPETLTSCKGLKFMKPLLLLKNWSWVVMSWCRLSLRTPGASACSACL
jgi:hypothetical protein